MYRRVLQFLSMLALFTGIARAAVSDPITIDDSHVISQILDSGNFEYQTTSEDLSAKDALRGTWISQRETPYQRKRESQHIWIKFQLKHNLSDDHNLAIYHASDFTICNLDVYEITNNTPTLIGASGTDVSMEKRSIFGRIPGVRLATRGPGSTEVLLHAKSENLFTPDIAVSPLNNFTWYIQYSNLFIGLCVGVLTIIMILTSSYALRLRDRGYMSVSLMVLTMILSILVENGFRDMIQIRVISAIESPELIKIFRPMMTFFYLNMTVIFLNLRLNMPRLYQWCQASMLSLVTLALLSFANGIGPYANDASHRMAFLGYALVLLAAYKTWRKGVPLSGYFLAATIFGSVMSMPLMLERLVNGSISSRALILSPVGQSIEMMILCLALIAKVQRMDQARLSAELEAAKSDELKSLLRVLSHDLNNPLAVISGYAHKGRSKMQKEGNAEMALFFDKIIAAARSQTEIINNVKDMRAVEDGKATIALAPVSLVQVMRQAEETFEQRLSDKNITLRYDRDKLATQKVLADETSLNHHVLNNIISNAIKFSHQGGHIDVSMDTDGQHIALVVEDHGIGMPRDLVSNIFRKDIPTSRSGTNGEKGTGFGMPVVKAYMEKFGGDIEIQSQSETESPGQHGTRVTLKFKKSA